MMSNATRFRARQRQLGMKTTEAILHSREIEMLDRLKVELGLSSRSDAMRAILASVDVDRIAAAHKEGRSSVTSNMSQETS